MTDIPGKDLKLGGKDANQHLRSKRYQPTVTAPADGDGASAPGGGGESIAANGPTGVISYHDLFEADPEPCLVTDQAGLILAANRSAIAFLGSPEKSMAGERLAAVFDDAEGQLAKRLAAFRDANEPEAEWTLERRSHDNQRVAVRARVSRIRMSSVGGPILRWRLEATHEPLTAGERREIAQFAIDKSPEGFFLTERSGGFVNVNEAACRMLGYEREELLALKVWDITPDIDAAGWPESWERSKRQDVSELQSNMRTRNGRLVPVGLLRTHWSLGGRELECVFARDITAQRRVEANLRDINELLESIFSNVPYLIAYLDRDFNFIKVNRAYAESDHRAPEFFVGRNHFDLYPNAENEAIFRKVVEERRAFYTYARPFVYPEHPERGVTYWDWSLQPILTDEGEVHSLIFTLINATGRKRMEEELRRSQEQFETCVENMLDCFAICTAVRDRAGAIVDFRVDYANRAAVEMSGLAREEGIGRRLSDLVPAYRALDVYASLTRVVETGRPLRMDSFTFHDRIGGRFLSLALDLSAVKYGDGFAVAWRNVSERKQALDALRESEMRFRATFDQTYQYMWLLGPEGTIIEANQTALQLTGQDLFELVGQPFWDCRCWLDEPAERERLRQAIAEAAAGAFVRYEMRARNASQRPVYIDFSIKPVRDGRGSVILLIPEGRDVTDRKQAEEALRRSEEYFRSLIVNAQDIILILDRDASIRYVSPSLHRLLGYIPEEMVGQPADVYLHPDDLPDIMTGFAEIVQQPNATLLREFRVRHRDSSWRVLEGFAKNLLEDEAVSGVIVNARDISERKAAEEKLRELLKRVVNAHEIERRRLARELHDGVNQILSSAKFRAHAAEEMISRRNQPARNEIRKVRDLLDGTIQEIRGISRNLRPSILDNLGLIASIQLLCDDLGKNGPAVEFRHNVQKEKFPPEIELNLYRITQEAISNIEKHAQATRVDVQLMLEPKKISLMITDNGVGFEEKPATGIGENQGLGLLNIADRSMCIGGKYSILSTPGGGTEISVQVPRGG